MASSKEYLDFILEQLSGLDEITYKGLYVYDDGVVKGFIKIEGTYIARLFVEPILQNASIGTQLLEYAVNKHEADHLWALERNTKAIRFYERNGFDITGDWKPTTTWLWVFCCLN